MTNEEICREYQQAKNKQYQIKILADENLCSVEEIRQILINAGVLNPKKSKHTVSVTSEQIVLTDWKDALKLLTERVTELLQQKESAEKELSMIYAAIGELCKKM